MILLVIVAQAAAASLPSPVPLTNANQRAAVGSIVLAKNTPVELMAPTEVSTADATAGTIFKLRVNRAIQVNGATVVPVGTPAFGQVVSAIDSGGLGKSGRMTAKLLNIRLGSTEIPLEGETSAKGTGAGSAGVAVLFTGVIGLFHRGNNAKIKAGELLVGYVAQDVTLPTSAPALPATVPPTPTLVTSAP
jgi:hypothetical protein